MKLGQIADSYGDNEVVLILHDYAVRLETAVLLLTEDCIKYKVPVPKWILDQVEEILDDPAPTD